MRRVHVIRLAKRLLGDFPVGVNHLGDVRLLVAALEIPDLEVIIHLANEVRERLGVFIGVDEHEPGPHTGLGLRQLEVLRLDMREVPLSRNVLQVTVDRPRIPVERATNL